LACGLRVRTVTDRLEGCMRFAVTLAALTLIASPALAQPSKPSEDGPAIIERFERGTPTSKSDAYRVVGKVVEIDKQGGVVKLQTEDGVVTTKPRPELVRAARVGDT